MARLDINDRKFRRQEWFLKIICTGKTWFPDHFLTIPGHFLTFPDISWLFLTITEKHSIFPDPYWPYEPCYRAFPILPPWMLCLYVWVTLRYLWLDKNWTFFFIKYGCIFVRSSWGTLNHTLRGRFNRCIVPHWGRLNQFIVPPLRWVERAQATLLQYLRHFKFIFSIELTKSLKNIIYPYKRFKWVNVIDIAEQMAFV